jgi:hypothetical protein
MPVITGTAFEEYVWNNWWLRKLPTSGWNSESQVPLAGGYMVDFVAYRRNERAVGDPKTRRV